MNPLSDSSIKIRTGSRLHCGLFSDSRPGGYHFQGMGLMIDSPGFEITATLASNSTSTHQIEADDEIAPRIEKSLKMMEQAFGGSGNRWLKICVKNVIPLHCGFGSGTQLAIATGRLWAAFHSPELSTEQIANGLDRGKRSCIGTFGFEAGGLLIDQGVKETDSFGRCRFQTSMPEAWRVLLVKPQNSQGLSGENETIAFQQLAELPHTQVDRLQQLLQIMEESSNNYPIFSDALREYGLIVGESFAAVQGGCFSDPIGQKVFDLLTSHGLKGIAQSSWGPTMFGLCETFEQSTKLKTIVLKKLPDAAVTIAKIQNNGSQLEAR